MAPLSPTSSAMSPTPATASCSLTSRRTFRKAGFGISAMVPPNRAESFAYLSQQWQLHGLPLIVTNTLGADTWCAPTSLRWLIRLPRASPATTRSVRAKPRRSPLLVSPSYDVTWETSGGTVVGTGTTFTTPALTATTTYRAIASTQSSVVNVGRRMRASAVAGIMPPPSKVRRSSPPCTDASAFGMGGCLGTADRTINLYNQRAVRFCRR